ncbi:helix-turn-helix transcriptional regulator [Amycolatopsis azurea]|uniref:Transcriptional regulator n=1 Tax=Amycolatopsis azurea DSM 43854 TaxID=1238180 RepID=M2P393_9PSEU|nr:helix-turn-helix transcriptional regulator [Amycolatopsis azurea]EMD29624.1 transcriptional regulator, XRE family [Amycolatopsis azurea DSM 43854]OOC07595.1 transcriptional regulator [Amycolatopsis azurea DSM 43854]
MAETFGDALRRLRVARGLSQSKLAQRVPVHTSNVSRYESGQQHPEESIAARLDELLGAGGALLARWSPLDVGPLDADQRDRIEYSRRFPGRIDEAAISALADSLAAQRRLDDVLGPLPLLPASIAQSEMVTGLLKEVNGPLRLQLASVASEHVQFAGWLHAEARHDSEAMRLLCEAEELADEAADGALAAQALNFKGYLARQQGRPRAMIRGFLCAYHTPGAHVSQRIGDAIQAAQGYAKIVERDEALRLLDTADGMIDDAGRDEPPGTAYWLTPTFHRLNSGLAHLALGDNDVAVDHLQTGLGNLPEDQRGAEWTNEYRNGLDQAKAAS